jgi:hypothetical protein
MPTCSKKRYPTMKAAKIVLVACRARRALHDQSKRREQGAYRCPHCYGYHLTSQQKAGSA